MARTTARIENEAGIHCRPSAHIIKAVEGYSGELTVTNPDGESSDLRSMLSLMMLALTCGTEVTLDVVGEDEALWLKKLVELFTYHYDFPSRED